MGHTKEAPAVPVAVAVAGKVDRRSLSHRDNGGGDHNRPTTMAAVAAATHVVPPPPPAKERTLDSNATATAAPLSSAFHHQPNHNHRNGSLRNNIDTTAATAATTATNLESSSSSRRSLWRLVVCATGINVCYLTYGVLQERFLLSSSSSSHHHNRSWGASFLLLTQCVTNVGVALVWQRLHPQHRHPQQQQLSTSPTSSSSSSSTKSQNQPTTSLPHGLLLLTAACYVTAMVCSNEAIRYVSYPVQVLAKSCKLIPTLLVGQLVERRLYRPSEWMAALCISVGIVLFHTTSRPAAANNKNAAATATRNRSSVDFDSAAAWTDHHSHHHDNEYNYGLWLLVGSLTIDGVLSSLQNRLKQARRPPNAVETMLYVNLYAILFLHPFCVVTGQWEAAVGSRRDHHHSTWLRETAGRLVLLNAAAAAGQVFIFLSLAWFTPVVTTTITTTRKFWTILLSVGLYGHTFHGPQWLSVGLVFVGLYVAILTTVRGGGAANTQKIKQA